MKGQNTITFKFDILIKEEAKNLCNLKHYNDEVSFIKDNNKSLNIDLISNNDFQDIGKLCGQFDTEAGNEVTCNRENEIFTDKGKPSNLIRAFPQLYIGDKLKNIKSLASLNPQSQRENIKE